MSKDLIENGQFSNIDFKSESPAATEFEQCIFNVCDFGEADLSQLVFTGCEFNSCNFTLTKVANTAFRDARFKDCKFTGVHFEDCKPMLFEVYFDHCNISVTSFYKLRLKQTKFVHCKILESDFSEADLGAAIFDNCDLSATVFDQTNLEKADLRSSFNFTIDPEKNRIKKAVFSAQQLQGLLGKYDIKIVP